MIIWKVLLLNYGVWEEGNCLKKDIMKVVGCYAGWKKSISKGK